MRIFVRHSTDYEFSEPQARVVQLLRLTPQSNAGQNIVDWRIDVDCDARLRRARDGFGNETSMLYINGPTEHVRLTVTGEVLTDDRAGVLGGVAEPLPPQLFLRPTSCTPLREGVAEFAAEAAGEGSVLDRAHRLNTAVHERIDFDPGRRADARDAAAVLADGHGARQDLTHLFIASARAIGIPARYVSGHRYDREHADLLQETVHAWAEAFVDGYGWIGFDPSFDYCADDSYVRVAVGLDYRDAAPVSGTRTGGGVEKLEVGIRVATSKVQTRTGWADREWAPGGARGGGR